MASAFTGSRNRIGSHQAFARPGDVRGGLFRGAASSYRDLLRELWLAGRYTRSRVQLISARVPVHVSTERQCHWALTSTGRRLDLSTSGLALLRDRDHWRLLRSEWGDGAGEVEGVAFAADSKNPARMVCNRRFWLVGCVRVRKGSGFSRHRDMTIPLVGQFREPKDLRHASRGYLRDAPKLFTSVKIFRL